MTPTLRMFLIGATLCLMRGADDLNAQTSFAMTRSVVAGGGATALAGGSYSLGGTLGQPAAGVMARDCESLSSGFWGVALTSQDSSAIHLEIVRQPGVLLISWPDAAPRLLLQQTHSLSEPDWQPVVGLPESGNCRLQMMVPLADQNLFFQLRPPN